MKNRVSFPLINSPMMNYHYAWTYVKCDVASSTIFRVLYTYNNQRWLLGLAKGAGPHPGIVLCASADIKDQSYTLSVTASTVSQLSPLKSLKVEKQCIAWAVSFVGRLVAVAIP
jgi:hypothetical protein